MSALVSCSALGYSVGGRQLFAGLSFTINRGDRIGLTGHNGSGKTTLLRLLAGELAPDEGGVQYRQGLKLARVEQFLPEEVGDLDLVAAVSQEMPGEIRDTESYRAERALSRLGFAEEQQRLKVCHLSGGQQNRLLLARALVGEPDVLLLDEPSNHMDLATLALLERLLTDGSCPAFLLVSHDRALLDAVTERTLVLRDGRCYDFALPFSAARQALLEMDIAARATRADEEKKIAALRASAKRLAVWGRVYDNEKLARKAKHMEKRAARLELARTFVSRGSGLDLTLSTTETRSRQLLTVQDLDVRPPGTDHPILYHVEELVIRPGDRVALLGANGCGKTSLLVALMAASEDPADERIRFSPQVVVGYYDQELNTVASERRSETMAEYLRRTSRASDREIILGLVHAGFPHREHGRRLTALSGGERARLLFLKLKLSRPNFLILDEPTNHIDIEGREALEEQVSQSGAAVLMTSHDRRFIDNVANRFLLVESGQLREIHDPEPFYDSVTGDLERADDRSVATGVGAGTGAFEAEGLSALEDAESPDGDGPTGEEALLARIVELEALIEADRARKPRFQKPARQAAWQDELNALLVRLETLDDR